jgi:Fe-S cluster biosynthesis and repair protein YggX
MMDDDNFPYPNELGDAMFAAVLHLLNNDWAKLQGAQKKLFQIVESSSKELVEKSISDFFKGYSLTGLEGHCKNCGHSRAEHAGRRCLFDPNSFYDGCKHAIPPAALEELKKGNFIHAVKETRMAAGWGLKEAKEACEEEQYIHGWHSPTSSR